SAVEPVVALDLRVALDIGRSERVPGARDADLAPLAVDDEEVSAPLAASPGARAPRERDERAGRGVDVLLRRRAYERGRDDRGERGEDEGDEQELDEGESLRAMRHRVVLLAP